MNQTDDLELKDESIYPDESVLKNILGESFGLYVNFLNLVQKYEMTIEWRYYRDGKAWLCKVQHKKRTIIWMSVHTSFIKATVYFPVSKIDLVQSLEIDQDSKNRIESTKNVGKLKPCTFDIRDERVLLDLEKVVDLKIRTK